MKKTNILLVGHSGYKNRGCEAIIRSTSAMLKEEIPHSRIILSSFDRRNDLKVKIEGISKIVDAMSAEIQYINNSRLKWKPWTREWFVRNMYEKILKTNLSIVEFNPIIKCLNNTDVVISVGGDNYSLDYGFPEYFINLNKVVKNRRKKLVLWAVSMGPFLDSEKRKVIIENLSQVDLITVRESCTYKYLHDLGLRNIKYVADPAFLLPPLPFDTSAYFDNGVKSVGINISPLIFKYLNSKEENTNKYNEFIMFVKRIIEKYKMNVILIPHVMLDSLENNDYLMLKNILKIIGDNDKIKLISTEFNSMELKYIISKCDYFIGARTHSTIAALSSYVPTLSLGYSVKSKGINKDIFDSEDYLLDINNLTLEKLEEKFDLLIANEFQIKDILKQKIPCLISAAKKNALYVKEIL